MREETVKEEEGVGGRREREEWGETDKIERPKGRDLSEWITRKDKGREKRKRAGKEDWKTWAVKGKSETGGE